MPKRRSTYIRRPRRWSGMTPGDEAATLTIIVLAAIAMAALIWAAVVTGTLP